MPIVLTYKIERKSAYGLCKHSVVSNVSVIYCIKALFQLCPCVYCIKNLFYDFNSFNCYMYIFYHKFFVNKNNLKWKFNKQIYLFIVTSLVKTCDCKYVQFSEFVFRINGTKKVHMHIKLPRH